MNLRSLHKFGVVVSLCCILIFSFRAIGGSMAQQLAPPGTIRIRVTLIPVDVMVTDEDGKPVLDLKKEDFAVFENGVRQEIRHFSLEVLIPHSPEGGSKALLRRVPTMELSPEKERTFLILLGRGRLQTPFKSVDAAINFVRRGLLPQDRVAVFAYNRATDFTTDHDQIAQVLERYKKIHEKIESELSLRFSGLAAIYGSREIPKSTQPEIDRIFEGPGAPGSRQLPPGRITDSGQIAQDSRQVTEALERAAASDIPSNAQNSSAVAPLSTSPLERIQTDALTDLPFEEFVSTNAMTMQDLQNIYTSIEYLRYMEGEKHLLFFTENGLFLPRLENDKSIAAMANDARVRIDTFQTGGVFPDGLPSVIDASSSRPGRPPVFKRPSASRTFALGSLRNISLFTGGQAFIHEDISKALSRIDETTRSEYLLGYYPKNANWDGRYRRIVVRVNRPGVRVYFRHGYYARDSLQPYDREAFMTYSRIAAAGGYTSEIKDLQFSVKAVEERTSPDSGQIRVDLSVTPTHVPFQAVNGVHKGKLYITFFYGDSKGRFLGDAWETMEMNLREETFQRAMKEGIPFSFLIPREVANESIKVVVYNYDSDKVGSLFVKAR